MSTSQEWNADAYIEFMNSRINRNVNAYTEVMNSRINITSEEGE